MKYDVDYFIDKYERIPDRNWLTGRYANHDDTIACALGHCGERTNSFTLGVRGTEESIALKKLFGDWLQLNPSDVNDDSAMDNPYHQSCAKDRILAALYDIKEKQKHHHGVERIVYVTVDSEVRQLQQEILIEN